MQFRAYQCLTRKVDRIL